MDLDIEEFVHQLSLHPVNGSVSNPYSFDEIENDVRRNNLRLYLTEMQVLKPNVMLIGEAPGYKGCKLTGVPFTSEYIMMNGIEDKTLFGSTKGYMRVGNNTKLSKEQSAAIVWQTLTAHRFFPLMWNAFPFHPHRESSPSSNRTPTKCELQTGKHYIQLLIDIFDIITVVAVGNSAERAINSLGIECKKVRHPANGGKADFVSGIMTVIENK